MIVAISRVLLAIAGFLFVATALYDLRIGKWRVQRATGIPLSWLIWRVSLLVSVIVLGLIVRGQSY